MRKIIILALLAIAVAIFAQTTINWWVVDEGGGMRSPTAGDTLWASIGQGIVSGGCVTGCPVVICAGYLYLFEGTCVKIDEEPGEDGKPNSRPYVFGINSTSPNPFNPTCAIEFEVESDAPVNFEFFDILGKVVDTPIRGERMTPGRYRLTWGGDLPSGTYFARLSSGEKSVTKRLVYLK
jgi:hypothetical protein